MMAKMEKCKKGNVWKQNANVSLLSLYQAASTTWFCVTAKCETQSQHATRAIVADLLYVPLVGACGSRVRRESAKVVSSIKIFWKLKISKNKQTDGQAPGIIRFRDTPQKSLVL